MNKMIASHINRPMCIPLPFDYQFTTYRPPGALPQTRNRARHTLRINPTISAITAMISRRWIAKAVTLNTAKPRIQRKNRMTAIQMSNPTQRPPCGSVCNVRPGKECQELFPRAGWRGARGRAQRMGAQPLVWLVAGRVEPPAFVNDSVDIRG